MPDEPIFSSLTGKFDPNNPCANCSGYCDVPSGADTQSNATFQCNDNAAFPELFGYTTGSCLGVWYSNEEGFWKYANCFN
jgi:hypothetical protein